MYAVYVLAAILLSVAPMHATTVLAALPAVARGERANSARVVRGERIACKSGQTSPSTCGHAIRRVLVEPPAQQPTTAERMRARASSQVDAHLLAHSPHAP